MLSYEPNLQDLPRLWPLLHSFLTGEEEPEEDLVAHLSLMEDENSRLPATPDQMLLIEMKWGSFLHIQNNTVDLDKCVICLQNLETEVVGLGCQCNNYFHRKCVLEWFYFNEKELEGGAHCVSCPSCRHEFET